MSLWAMEIKEGCKISYQQRWNYEANAEKKSIEQTSQMDLRLCWELPGVWEPQRDWNSLAEDSKGKRLGLKGKEMVFYRDIWALEVNFYSRYSAQQVNYWGNQNGKKHLDVQGRDILWADSHTLCLSVCFSYLKEAPIFLQRCFSPKAVNKSTKLIAAVVLSVLWTEHWIWLMGLCQAGISPGQ